MTMMMILSFFFSVLPNGLQTENGNKIINDDDCVCVLNSGEIVK